MKPLLEVVEQMCGHSNICKLNVKELQKQTGLTTYKTYQELMRCQKNGYLNVFTEQGTTYIRVK